MTLPDIAESSEYDLVDYISRLHKRLVSGKQGERDESPGGYRQTPIKVGPTPSDRFPPPEEVEHWMDRLDKWVKQHTGRSGTVLTKSSNINPRSGPSCSCCLCTHYICIHSPILGWKWTSRPVAAEYHVNAQQGISSVCTTANLPTPSAL